VTVTLTDCEGGFAVSDDGPGIPDGAHDAVFERGYTSIEDGTGFGLAIVQNIAEAHDWTIEAVPPDGPERASRSPASRTSSDGPGLRFVEGLCDVREPLFGGSNAS
jgi:Signal transduction histidine kinase